MPDELEIDLSGGMPVSKPSTSKPGASASAVEASKSNATVNQVNINDSQPFNAAVSDKLRSQITDDSTADEILDAILQAPEADLLPWEDVHLPSRGIYYGDKIPGGVIQIRPMGIQADKILATARLAQSGQSLDYLYANCVRLPNGFAHEDLLAGDRNFLLYVLRGVTHGNIYEFLLTCPNSECGDTSSYTYDLNSLAATIRKANPANGTEPFKVSLPYLSQATGRDAWVTVRLLRGRDISTIASRQKVNKKIAPGAKNVGANKFNNATDTIDESLTQNLNLVITSFMGVQDPGKIKNLVARLHSSDTAAIREFLKDNSPGIDTSIEVQCPNCGSSFKTELPITESFFRPSNGR